MATEAQFNANRANAQKSTGPSTDAGKASACQNALKTGIYAESDILKTEDPEELAQLTAEFYAAVEEALRLGVTDAAAVIHLVRMPDGEDRRRHALQLAAELAEFERPMPVGDEYDQLLGDTEVIQ